MQLVAPFIKDRATMRQVCVYERGPNAGQCRYTDVLLAALPDWIDDSKNERMTRGAQLVGFNRERAVWLFGFTPGSDDARAHGIDTGDQGFLFVLATHAGHILGVFNGLALELPAVFRRVIDGKW